MFKLNIDKIEIVTLPKMRVAFFKNFSHTPESETAIMAEKWLKKYGLQVNGNDIRDFGFDCDEFPTNRPDGKHTYVRYVSIPENIPMDREDNIRIFNGGKYARLTVTDPFSGDFPDGWNKLVEWVLANGYRNKNICKSTGRCNPCLSDCWNSTEEEPDLEELHEKDGIQYMDFYLPIE